MEHLLTREFLWKHALTGVFPSGESSCIQFFERGTPFRLQNSAPLRVLGSARREAPTYD